MIMIDTTRIKAPVTPKIYELMRKHAKRYSKNDEVTGHIDYEYHRNEIRLGSFNRDLNIKLPDPEKFYAGTQYQFVIIELSLPKYTFGHNVFLLYPSKIPYVFEKLYNEFVEKFGDFTHFSKWRIKRVDLSYAWNFKEFDIANTHLNLARPLKYPQKRLRQYETGVGNLGRYHYLKFYLKYPEFRANDFKVLQEKGLVDLSHFALNLSKGVLRFEVKFEEEVFQTHFEKPFLYYRDISDNARIEGILQNHIDTLFKFADKSGVNNMTAKEKLEKIYDLNRAGDLYSLWKLIYSVDPAERDILKRNYSRWKVYRAKKELLAAGVGVPSFAPSDVSFNFSIPSPFAINQDIALSALAEMR